MGKKCDIYILNDQRSLSMAVAAGTLLGGHNIARSMAVQRTSKTVPKLVAPASMTWRGDHLSFVNVNMRNRIEVCVK